MKRRAFVLLALVSSGLAGCLTEVPRDAVGPRPPAPRSVFVTPSGEVAVEPEAPASGLPGVRIEDTQGVEVPRARADLYRARGPLRNCMADQSGIAWLRIARSGDSVVMNVGPGTTLDPRQRTCVLEAISTLNFEEQWNRSSPGDKPAGFVAVVRIDF